MAEADWTILQEEGMEPVLQAVARKAGKVYGLTLEREDAEQEARIILAVNAAYARERVKEAGFAGLNRWLWQQVSHIVRYEHKHRDETDSLDEMSGWTAEGVAA